MTTTEKFVEMPVPQEEGFPKLKQHKIVVLIPTYNEENGIKPIVEKTQQVLSRMADRHNIVVVDDGSKDSTRSIIDYLDVERFFHRHNLGKGDVIRNALEFLSPGEIVVTMDGDGEHDPDDLPRLIYPILTGKADMVIGSRFKNESNRIHHYLGRQKEGKFFKNFGNRLFSFLLWIFTGKKIKDTQSGYRAFKAGTAKKLHLSADGFRIEMEMTVKAIKKGYKIKEVQIENGLGARSSHLNPVIDGARITLTIFRECLPDGINSIFNWILPRLPREFGKLIK